jgi:hypothetical protein
MMLKFANQNRWLKDHDVIHKRVTSGSPFQINGLSATDAPFYLALPFFSSRNA